MIIYSWNMLYRNAELERAFDFVSQTDFDLFCLQEVPPVFLERLKTLPCHIAFEIDTEKHLPSGKVEPMYNVILSHYPIVSQGIIPFEDYWATLPMRTRLFVRFMRPWHFSETRNRHGLFADLMKNDTRVRVFNLHLVLLQPAMRLKEFERAMLERDPEFPTIVCGDFNTLERPHITPLNWLLGGKATDTLFYTRERSHIERRFVEHSLTNVMRGKATHVLSRSQLDHILVSSVFRVQDASVLSDRYGSDHHPIVAEVVQ